MVSNGPMTSLRACTTTLELLAVKSSRGHRCCMWSMLTPTLLNLLLRMLVRLDLLGTRYVVRQTQQH